VCRIRRIIYRLSFFNIIVCRLVLSSIYTHASISGGYFPCLTARGFPREDCLIRPWHHSLLNFGSEIALSARIMMSAPLFAGSLRCTFTLTKKVAGPAVLLFRSISMAAARISASGALTNVAFPPSLPINLLTAFNNY